MALILHEQRTLAQWKLKKNYLYYNNKIFCFSSWRRMLDGKTLNSSPRWSIREKESGQSGDVKSVLDHQDIQQCPLQWIFRREIKNGGHSVNKRFRQAELSWGYPSQVASNNFLVFWFSLINQVSCTSQNNFTWNN